MIRDERFTGGTQPVRDAMHHKAADRFDPPLQHIDLDEVKAFCDAVLAELESRKNNTSAAKRKKAP